MVVKQVNSACKNFLTERGKSIMETSKHWRLKSQRYSLVGETCHSCNTKLFPPRDDAPAGFEGYAPYTVALIKLDEGPIVTAQLTDIESDDVQIGMPVEMVTRKLRTDGEEGMIVYGYKFRPVRFERVLAN